MKKLLFAFSLAMVFAACQLAEDPSWSAFKTCATNACVKEALAVRDAFLKNPQKLLTDFQNTYEKGEDHVIGWLYMMRDSVLFNPKMGSTEERIAMQQAIVNAARPFEKDPKVGEMARSVLGEIENLAIASENEDGVALEEPITGLYTFDLENDGGGGELRIKQLSLDKFQFEISVTAGPPAHNHGLMEGIATDFNPVAGSATFSMNKYGGDCSIEFSFSDGGVTLKTTKGEPAICGLGNNVMVDGKYARKSFADPFLKKNEALAVEKMFGEWISATDSTLSLKIADGKFVENAGGEEISSHFVYFPICPGDCNPIARSACIKLLGQDEVCFTVVKADGKTLEISQIGGTGNTNKYLRKK